MGKMSYPVMRTIKYDNSREGLRVNLDLYIELFHSGHIAPVWPCVIDGKEHCIVNVNSLSLTGIRVDGIYLAGIGQNDDSDMVVKLIAIEEPDWDGRDTVNLN